MSTPSLCDIDVAHLVADAARAAILPHFRSMELISDNKQEGGFDPVTAADRAAEEAMRAVLAQHRPDDGIWGEEFGRQEGASGRLWVLDPIDGTRGFICGTPTWGVLIALGHGGGAPHLGLIDQPYIGERFWTGPTGAAFQGPHGQGQLRTRATQSLSEAHLLTTFPEVGRVQDREGFQAVAEQTKLTRYGMDCYGYALLAAGQVDLVIEAGLQAYDIQAPIAVVAAAGGVVTNWRGAPAHDGGQAVAAATPELHAAALAVLRPFAD